MQGSASAKICLQVPRKCINLATHVEIVILLLHGVLCTAEIS